MAAIPYEYQPKPLRMLTPLVDAMVQELKSMNIELMVSIWPTVEKASDSYQDMLEEGYLIRTDRGVRIGLDFQSNTIHFDPTNPGARSYIWEKAKQNYYSKGNQSLLARRSRTRVHRLRLRHLSLLSWLQCHNWKHLPARIRPRFLRRHGSFRPKRHCESLTLCMGREPEIRGSGLERRHRILVD